MTASRFGLANDTIALIRKVLAAHPKIEKAVIYGSRAMGTHRDGSDIDLTLIGSGLGHADLIRIMGELDDLLLPYTIDLSLFASLSHADLLDHIKRVGVAFYEKHSCPGES